MNTEPTKAGDPIKAMTVATQQLSTEVAAVSVIKTREQYTTAGELIRGIDMLRRDIEGHYEPLVAAAHKTHKMLTEARKKMLAPLEQQRSIASRARLAWEEAQERAAEAERQRLAEEARRQHEEAALAAAEAAEAEGDTTLAEQIVAEAAEQGSTLAVKVEADIPKTDGLGVRRTLWDFEVVDPSKVKPEFMCVNEVAIGKVVRSMGEGAKALVGEGVRIYSRKSEEARGR